MDRDEMMPTWMARDLASGSSGMGDRPTRYLSLVWIVLAYPLTLLGYGSDPDAWRLARAADEIWMRGHYMVSRSTGFPLFELLEAPLVHFGGWYLANLLPLAAGLTCLVALRRLAANGMLDRANWVIALFALYPLTLTASTSAMDYLPALALLLWAYVDMREGLWRWAAVLVGLATGFRPSSVVFILPVCLYALALKRSRREVAAMLGIALAVGLLVYSPALLQPGQLHTFGKIEFGWRSHLILAAYNGLRVFGVLQSLLLAALIAWRLARGEGGRFRFDDPVVKFHLANIMLWLVLFWIAPYEPEYLLPAVLSFFLLSAQQLDGRWLTIGLLHRLLVPRDSGRCGGWRQRPAPSGHLAPAGCHDQGCSGPALQVVHAAGSDRLSECAAHGTDVRRTVDTHTERCVDLRFGTRDVPAERRPASRLRAHTRPGPAGGPARGAVQNRPLAGRTVGVLRRCRRWAARRCRDCGRLESVPRCAPGRQGDQSPVELPAPGRLRADSWRLVLSVAIDSWGGRSPS
jgi:hypothetical protein